MIKIDNNIWQLLIKKDERFGDLNNALTSQQKKKFWAINSSDISYYILQHECEQSLTDPTCYDSPKLTPEFITGKEDKITNCVFHYNFCRHFIEKTKLQKRRGNLLLDQSHNHYHHLNPRTQTWGLSELVSMLLSKHSIEKISHVISPDYQKLASRRRNLFAELIKLLIDTATAKNLKVVILETIILQQQYRNSFNEQGKRVMAGVEQKIGDGQVVIIQGIGEEMFSYSWVQYFCRIILWNEKHGRNVKIIFLTRFSATRLCKNYFNYRIERSINKKHEEQTIMKQIHWFASYLFDRYNYKACIYQFDYTGDKDTDISKSHWIKFSAEE